MAVVLYHSPFFYPGYSSQFVANSYVFVDFFFILSGFVMAFAYQDKIANGFSFRNFVMLRLGRIYPVHFLTLMLWLVWILSKLMMFSYGVETANPTIKNSGFSFLLNLFLVHSMDFSNGLNWNHPSWSVAVEFWTYIIFFWFCFATARWKNWLLPLAVSFGGYLAIYLLIKPIVINITTPYSLFRCLGGFFAGVALYRLCNRFRQLQLSKSLTWVTEIIAVVSVFMVIAYSPENSIALFLVIPAFLLALFAHSREQDGMIGWLLKTKVAQSIGNYSYSIYMLHALVFDLALNFTRHFFTDGKNEIYFYQTKWAFFINAGLVIVIIFASGYIFELFEKPLRERSRVMILKPSTNDLVEALKV